MKVAFISGPYRGKTHYDIEQNIREAEAVAIKYWCLGYAVVCPHKNSSHFDGLAPDDVWLKGTLAIMEKCDVIVMLPKWRESEGARNELERATLKGLEVIYE